MVASFCLAPRYRLDDEMPWLEGIDPSRQYWLNVNSDNHLTVAIAGLSTSSIPELKEVILEFRALQPGETMTITRIVNNLIIHCVGINCYAIEAEVNQAPVWHLFDQETLDSLLMTAHPDWQCAPSDIELGRKMLMRSFQQPALAK
ncbi:hypothetical protein [Calothrix sp. 336/3]|uniref:hypothetical protein n=1 Tax=Calothrix sp. 336/3 TaxID=1337936 RepID=UPI0004E3CFF4|nr:hypothetical protein [Calothrix sp. 336/3]AKG24104.1 hypothetical protein IJ00_24790 [Calothrix sp. 336/3]